MTIRLVDSGWDRELRDALRADASRLQIISPFVKEGAISRLLALRPGPVRVITRFNLDDFAEGVSDLRALRRLLDTGAVVRGIRNLHAKLYLFGTSTAIVTSANLTAAALDRNHEFGMVAVDPDVVSACGSYFQDLWQRGGPDLEHRQLDAWDDVVARYRASARELRRESPLPDFGADAGLAAAPIPLPVMIADARQAFVKFLGSSDTRAPRSLSTIEEVESSGCHWAVGYSRRPRTVRDGAIMFIARMTRDPNDIRIFGRAVGMEHQPGRDDATAEDIKRRPWKKNWQRYVRVHQAQFVAGTLDNGISLNELIAALGADCFATTHRHARSGNGNTNPRTAYQRQAAVELSDEGRAWLLERLELAFEKYGTVPQEALAKLDPPIVP